MKEYLLCYAETIKILNLNSNETNLTNNLNNLHYKINMNFRKQSKNFILQNINKNKNMKVNFYYYEHLLNALYDRLISCGIHFLTYKFTDYTEKNKDYKKIIDSIIKHSNLIFKNISEFVKEKLHEAGNEKFYNIPKEYASFEEYLKENLKKSYEIEDMYNDINILCISEGEGNIYSKINKTISYNEIYIITIKTLKEIFEISEI